MSGMAIGATGDFIRITKAIVFTMVTFHVRLDCNVGDVIPCHHLLVTVALHADLGVEFTDIMRLPVPHCLNVMQVVAIMAGGRILNTPGHRLAMDRIPVAGLLVVALDTLGDDDLLVTLPVLVGMNIRMAIGAADPFLRMNTEVMFRCLFLMAAVAGNLLNLDLLAHMFGKVGDIHMATGAGVLAMHRRGKGRHGDLAAMTAETGGRINGHPMFGHRGKSREGQK